MKLRHLVLLLLMLPAVTQARHLFYQPQNRDAPLTQEHWDDLWTQALDGGFDTVIVQWTAHGPSSFDGPEGWLREALQSAANTGLALVLGLDYDENYYTIMFSEQDKVYYWHHLLSRARQQQRALREWSLPIAGWYVPYELDDVIYQDRTLLNDIALQLRSFAEQSELPVHISAFSSGQLSPAVYARWLQTISESGLKVWWQDGAGTGRMPDEAIAAYLQNLPCAIGVVSERFRIISDATAPFQGVPADARAAVNPDPVGYGCHAEAVFSLRYLPFAERLRRDSPEPQP